MGQEWQYCRFTGVTNMKTPHNTAGRLFVAALFCVMSTGVAWAEIVFLAPPSASVPEGAWVANTPGISYGHSSAGYALQRSQAWRMQDNRSTPSAQNYWLVLPGATGGYNYGSGYGYSSSVAPYSEPVSARVANTRSHVARANAYRMKLFER
jgi:hypothetical protein